MPASPPPAAVSSVIGPVIGHRGAAGLAPENTLAGLAKAAALGVGWVEFDVRLTADGEAVLFHDETLERTTDGEGAVAETTLAQIRRLDAGAWFAPEFRGERVPTLAEAMVRLASLGLGANIEIKAPPGEVDGGAGTFRALAEKIAAGWPASLPAPLISSFDDTALATAAEVAPQFPRALAVAGLGDGMWRARAETAGAIAVHCAEKELTPAQAAAVTGAGYALRCFTVNDPARARTLYRWGAEGVFSDFPDRLRPPEPR